MDLCAQRSHWLPRADGLPDWQTGAVVGTHRLAKATHSGLYDYDLDALITHFALDDPALTDGSAAPSIGDV